MNGVMRMKRKLIIVGAVFLVLILILGGLFFWKGGHHALYLADELEDWLDADTGAAAVTFQLQRPDYAVDPDTGRITPQVGQLSLTADGSWCEYADEPLYCLTAEGISAYIREGIVCLDSGKAYTLPPPTDLSGTVKKLRTALILYGRVTKEGDTYTVTMDTEELELTVLITADKTLRSISATALLPDGTREQNYTSAADLADLMEHVLAGTMVSPTVSATMMQIMAGQQNGKFRPALPAVKHTDPRKPIDLPPEGKVLLSAKSGTLTNPNTANDAGILLLPNGRAAVLAMTTSTTSNAKKEPIMGQIARTVYEALK